MVRENTTVSAGQRKKPAPINLPSARLVDTPEAFGEMMAELGREPAVALDTESDSLYRYFYKVCVIQISTAHADYILDPLALPDLKPLGELLANPVIGKVFHAAENDILVLKRDFGFAFANIFDTMIAARILGLRRVSLAALLAENFGLEMDKRAQLTDWGHRPLTPEQLSYAHLDSHYLLPLRDLLTHDLKARGRWVEAQEAFAALPAITYVEKPFDPEGFWKSKGARDLSPQELAVLRELYLWRDAKARALNLPPFKVIDDRSLMTLSALQPVRVGDLPLSQYQVKRFGRELVEAIQRGQAAAPPPLPARNNHSDGYRPDPDTLARYDRLRVWRTQRAEERGVESDVVLTNDVLMAIARALPRTLDDLAALEIVGPWKLGEYGTEVLQVINNHKAV